MNCASLLGVRFHLRKPSLQTVKWFFLGILLDGVSHRLCVPIDKKYKALNLVRWMLSRKKVTIKQVQSLTGLLNFLNRALVPGRAFTRRMYSKLSLSDRSGNPLKQYHHVKLSDEFKSDLAMWEMFLEHHSVKALCRPFTDSKAELYAKDIGFYSDASGRIGMGCSFNERWIAGFWDPLFIKEKKPSIAYLELYALCAGLITWGSKLKNAKLIIYCDNKSVRDMVNHTTSGCKNCMVLMRILVINNLIHNRRVVVRYIKSKDNCAADAISRGDIAKFKREHKLKVDEHPDKIPDFMWPPGKIWIN